jgi:D-alanyl-D-alanine carboxypeptidase/D-alanyl-D-alanine-endopeptidase (penicillin-binding protein 4)
MGRPDYLPPAAGLFLKLAVTHRRLVLLLVVVGVLSPVAAGAQETPLQARLAQALRVPHIAPARSAALAMDLVSGEVVFTQNAARPLAPASNEKLPLTYAVLSNLGASYRIETDVLGEGSQDGPLFEGTLVLKGGGDPTLTTAGLRALAAQVRGLGIRHVTGGIVGDESYFDARRTVAGWKPSFYLQESPPLSALVVDRARGTRTPALAAATSFRAALRRAGIAVDGGASVARVDDFSIQLAQIESPPLASILRFMDKESDNFTAELLLKQLGAVVLDRGTSAAGASVVMQTLGEAGVPLTGVRFVDGSGLSRLDRLTGNAIAALLRAAWDDPAVRPTFVAALPVAGVNGTLEDRLRTPPTRGRVLAKTGTTSDASALSGYVGTRFLFTVLQNGHPLPYWWARRAQDQFATVLARA